MRTRFGDIFHEVADLPAEARVRYFIEHDVDDETRAEVEELVAFDSDATDSLESDIGQIAQRALGRFEQGTQCGPYRLGDLLGSGGMGTVHLAERVDGEIAQRVAVKLLRPGADDPPLRERFLAERQILATLSHPNIARLLDAGHREDRQPYLVMEYIEGQAIDAYTSGLGIRQKIKLFLKVCAAVGYLHRNLVVHRDLKPSNILVTDEGEPKLLDFGLAKLLDLTFDSSVTSTRMLTPDYASPEQAAGRQVTTAADIYSLGAVLYRLLAGTSPHQFENGSMEAIASAICDGRITPPATIEPALKGDLEIILMKALRAEPQERYATVEQLSEDLENYLESRPIRARSGDVWYRTRRFLRRNWLPAGAATLALAGLSAGILVANHERAIAQRRFVQVRQLANKLFDIDVEARKVPGSTKTRQLIVDTSLEYLRRLSAEVRGDPDLALEVGNAYMRAARVQGVPISANLGQMDHAEQNLRKADGFIHSVLASQPANRTALLRLAQISHDRMLLARLSGRRDEALELAQKSAEWLDKFHAGIGDKSETSAILNTYLNVADQHMLGRRFDDALILCRHASELARSLGSQRYLGTFLYVSANVFRLRGDLDEALRQVRESAKILEPSVADTDQGPVMNYILALIYEGRILDSKNSISMGRPQEAVLTLERSFRMADTFVHKDASDQMARGRLAMAGLGMADILRESEANRSLAIYDHILRHLAEIKDNSSFRLFEVNALAGSTYPLRRLGRHAEARQRLDAAFERLRETKTYPAEKVRPGSELDIALCALGDYEADAGHVLRAAEIYGELVSKELAWGSKPEASLSDAVDMSRLYVALAAMYGRAGESEPAFAMEARRLGLWHHWDAKLPDNTFVRRQLNAASKRPRKDP